uniref:PAZ domain-containing protein n=1 Tax=Caenorhabditis tropicalis TaxID=1561998 RepID=A0A1I7V0X7_9PELO
MSSHFYQGEAAGGGGEGGESIEMSTKSEQQPPPDDQPSTSERRSPRTPPPPEFYYAVQITHNLINRVSITDCRETKDPLKAPLRNNNDDILFWEEAIPNEDVAPDIMERGPEVSIEHFEPVFFARILNRLIVEDHPMSIPRRNLVISYPGPYNSEMETGILREVRGLGLFEGQVFCFPESTVYHELFHSGRSATELHGEIPVIVYGGKENSFIHAMPRGVFYLGEDQGASLCSAYSLVSAAIEVYCRLSNEQLGPSQRQMIFPFESLVLNHFGVNNHEEVKAIAMVERRKTAELARFLNPDTCTVTKKAYVALRGKLVKEFIQMFGTEEPRILRVVCVGKMFTNHFHRFNFYADIHPKIRVKWQNNESQSLEKILAANTCLAALKDKIDLLKLDADPLVTRVIHRTDLSIELSAPIPLSDEVQF